MKKKMTAAALCLLLTLSSAGTALCLPNEESPAYGPAEKITKDETVYVSLDGSGAVSEIDVVNRIDTPADGVYTDYGDYEQVTNLTDGTVPQVSGDAVSWQLGASGEGFYYQGRLKQGELPFLLTVKYLLDGKETPAADMAGKSGKVTMRIEARPNAAAAEHFRKNYFCQIQAALDLDRCQGIDAPGSTGIIAGRSQNLGFTVLPGKSASFEISFEARDFSFDGFTMTAMPFDQKGMTGIDTGSIKEDIKKMSDGTQKLVDGTKDLKDGLGDLSKGVKKLSDGSKDAKAGLTKYKSGVKSYTGGVSTLAANARKIAAAMQALASNGKSLKDGYAQLSAGLNAVLSALSPMAPPELAGQIAALQGQLAAYQSGLDSYIDGVSGMATGMKKFSDGLDKLGKSGGALVSGMTDIVDGMAKLTDGLTKTAEEMNKLPGEVQKLVDGQTELKNGVDEASGTFNAWDFGADASASPVSFVSPKNSPRSVQFICKTPQIAKPDDSKQASPQQEQQKGFFEKFLDLFR